MPSKEWLRAHYHHEPKDLREILINDHLSEDLPTLKKYLRKYPKNYTLHASIADHYWDSGRKRSALRKWHETVDLFPRAANPFFQRAHWALNARNFKEASKYLRLCLRKDKGYFRETAHFWRAEALFRIGAYAAAKKELDNVSDDYEEQYFLEYKKRGKADVLSDVQESEKELEELGGRPRLSNSYVSKGRTCQST